MKALKSHLQADSQNYINTGNWISMPLKAGIEEVKYWQNNYDELYQKGIVKLDGAPLQISKQVNMVDCIQLETSSYEYNVSMLCNEPINDLKRHHLFAQNMEDILSKRLVIISHLLEDDVVNQCFKDTFQEYQDKRKQMGIDDIRKFWAP